MEDNRRGGNGRRTEGRREYGSRPRRTFNEGGERRSFDGDRKPFGERKSFGDRPRRSFGEGGERPRRSFGENNFGGERK